MLFPSGTVEGGHRGEETAPEKSNLLCLMKSIGREERRRETTVLQRAELLQQQLNNTKVLHISREVKVLFLGSVAQRNSEMAWL